METMQNQMQSLRLSENKLGRVIKPSKGGGGILSSRRKNGANYRIPGQRVKQISHESNSSFFTNATAVSTVVGNEEEEFVVVNPISADVLYEASDEASSSGCSESTATLQVSNNHNKACQDIVQTSASISPSSSFEDNHATAVPTPELSTSSSSFETNPIQTVFDFLTLTTKGYTREAAEMFLHPAVTISFPGRPFCASAAEWVQHERLYGSIHPKYSWHVLERGAHEYQVVRRGHEQKNKKNGRHSNNGASVVQVFELAHAVGNDDRSSLQIVAMYLRKTPKQWSFGFFRPDAMKKNGGASTRKSRSSQRIQGILEEQEFRQLCLEMGFSESSDEEY